MDPEAHPQMFQELTGKLLLADTTLRHSAFCRSVVYLADHSRDGALGYVLNQPLDRMVSGLLDGVEFEELAEVPVYVGGPVHPDRISFAAMEWDLRNGVFRFDSQLSAEDARKAVISGKDVRAYVGYSGWSPGQVEREIKERAWMVQDASPALTEPEMIPQLWFRLLHDMGAYYQMVSLTPAWPENN